MASSAGLGLVSYYGVRFCELFAIHTTSQQNIYVNLWRPSASVGYGWAVSNCCCLLPSLRTHPSSCRLLHVQRALVGVKESEYFSCMINHKYLTITKIVYSTVCQTINLLIMVPHFSVLHLFPLLIVGAPVSASRRLLEWHLFHPSIQRWRGLGFCWPTGRGYAASCLYNWLSRSRPPSKHQPAARPSVLTLLLAQVT